MSEVIVDVRESDEYESQHVQGSVNVPLSKFALVAPGVFNQLKVRKIVFMCHSGVRAMQASQLARGLGFNAEHEYEVYPGGIMAWIRDGNPVQKAGKAPLPLIRQVQIIMGLLVLVSAGLGAFLTPWFSVATLLIGAGMVFAGVTGDCALASTVAKAPWNKADPNLKKVYCQASSGCAE
jgi:rhodanese-related sulfurtransferase